MRTCRLVRDPVDSSAACLRLRVGAGADGAAVACCQVDCLLQTGAVATFIGDHATMTASTNVILGAVLQGGNVDGKLCGLQGRWRA